MTVQLGNYVMSKDFQNFMGCAAAEYKAAMALDSGDVMEENPVDLDSEVFDDIFSNVSD